MLWCEVLRLPPTPSTLVGSLQGELATEYTLQAVAPLATTQIPLSVVGSP